MSSDDIKTDSKASSSSYDAYNSTNFDLPITSRIHDYLDSIVSDAIYQGFENPLLSHVTLSQIDPAKQQTTYTFTVQGFMCNRDGVLHGGAISALFDNLSSTALYTINMSK